MSRKPVDTTGKTFGRLTVLRTFRNEKWFAAECKCECGKIVVVPNSRVSSGHTRSCGCLTNWRPPGSQPLVDGVPRSTHPLFATWSLMLLRCDATKAIEKHRRYWGRGILVCDRWRTSFEAFVADIGPKPSELHSVDRINNDGNYEPGNCRWATNEQQMSNRGRPIALAYSKTQFIGVFKQHHLYLTRVTIAGKRYVSRGFVTADEAAAHYDELVSRHGLKRRLNMPRDKTIAG